MCAPRSGCRSCLPFPFSLSPFSLRSAGSEHALRESDRLAITQRRRNHLTQLPSKGVRAAWLAGRGVRIREVPSHYRPRYTLTSMSADARVRVGTSGYNYPEWRGSFYPEKFSTAKMLAYYAERFNTVEVNYTFYRIPTPALLEGWAKGTPEDFTFTLKAPRRITHDSKLQRCEELTQVFCKTATTLGSKLGVLLFQLPPTFKRDDAVLGQFLDLLPQGTRAAFEFRHPSWHDDVVFDALRRRNLALCVA